jgi:hypothetical protein
MVTSSTSMACALLVSAEPVAIQYFTRALKEFSIAPEVCHDVPTSISLLNKQKFDAVFIDLDLGDKAVGILEAVRLSRSNQTAVTFAIGASDADATALLRKRTGFLFERPFSMHSIRATIKPAYGLILRERRRYFRYPIVIPVVISRQSMPEIRCSSANISEAGLAGSTSVPLTATEDVQVQFNLPDGTLPYVVESRICWWRDGRVGVRFISLSEKRKSELQAWLTQKQEEMLPEFVARKFQRADNASVAGLSEAEQDTKIEIPKPRSGRAQFKRLMRLH